MVFLRALGQSIQTRFGFGWPNATRNEKPLRPVLDLVGRVRPLASSHFFRTPGIQYLSITALPNVTGSCCNGK